MTIDLRNADLLNNIQRTIDAFERTYSLSSDDMLTCEEGDQRLSQIDSFQLMDWHYALDQRKALSFVVSNIHALATSLRAAAGFPYARTMSCELANSPEQEMLLVA